MIKRHLRPVWPVIRHVSRTVLFVALGTVVMAATLGVTSISAADNVPSGMILVGGGEFIMGTNEEDHNGDHTIREYSDAYPQHKVNVGPFYIDKTEVTNEQYKAYCDATHYLVPPHWKNGTYAAGDGNLPVWNVDWWEASAYAKWAGKRLPTEAEWEKTARGTDGRRYPWGGGWDTSKVSMGEKLKRPEPVGSHPDGASPYGALDMSGNVMEWVQDWYQGYPGTNQHYAEYGTNFKVVRGGGYMGFEFLALTFYRCVAKPETRSEWIGFRCAKNAG